jgi:PTS system nitrogen regulatory IIA component
MSNDFEVMTLPEVAQYLQIGERTILKMANNNEIPCLKIASQWRFIKPVINDWLISRMNVIPQNDFSRMIQSEIEHIPLSRMVDRDLVVFNLEPGSKESILLQLIRPLVNKGIISISDEFLQKLLNREEMLSTGLGRGIAIPHIRNVKDNPDGGPYLILGLSPEGIDYHSLDGKPTHLFFLLCTDSEVLHIRIMAKISSMFTDDSFIDIIKTCNDYQSLIQAILRMEHKLQYNDIA